MLSKTAPEVRFWRKVQKRKEGQCWPWLGDKTYHGYGRFSPYPIRSKPGRPKPSPVMAHRLAWQYTHGPIPNGLECCHRCDNKPCCNPAHLFLATHKENMADMVQKGRQAFLKGELHGEAKLTEKEVRQIRNDYVPYVVTLNTLAGRFGVSKKLIFLIVHHLAWQHLA